MSRRDAPRPPPAHLAPYASPCPPDLALALRGDRPTRGEQATFALACRCGEASLLVGVAYNWEVVDAACTACGHEFPIYDPTAHGLLGAAGRNDYARSPFEPVPFGCMCRMMHFRLAVLVEYARPTDGPEAFSFVAVAGRCAACGMTNLVLDADCD